MLKGDRSFHRRWEIVLADDKTSTKKPPFYIRRFFLILILFGFLGGFLALTVPLWKSWTYVPFLSPLIPANSTDYSESKAIADLRLHILYITGGIIAILTLLQTDWKNQIDRRKVEDDIQKNKNDHNRQVHAERRSRYTKAVEQLANEKAAVRLGGIYTLVGLVDEWLADNTLEPKERQKEGQVIINNLCSYIRSPFPLAAKIEEYEARKELEKLQKTESEKLREAESSRLQVLLRRFKDSGEYKKPKDISADYAKFQEEQDVRRAIFVEMSKRSSKVSVDKSKEVTVTPGAWSGFKFDFSRAPIFYPLNNLTIEQGNFASTRFYGKADFEGAKFARDAYFTDARFAGDAYFTDTKFAGAAYFGGAEFTGDVGANKAEFIGDAYFGGSGFIGDAYFGSAKFTRNADFKGTEFIGIADFGSAEFIGIADFLGTGFTDYTNFRCAYFEKCAPTFANESGPARFSAQVIQKDCFFSVRKGSKPIHRGTTALPPMSFAKIPLGAVLFDPASWDEEKQKYTRISEPAKT